MTISTTVIIDSLENYVLDIKPYHSKLSDVIIEYEFFDDVKVKIAEKHTIAALLNSIWSESYISGPAYAVTKYPLRASFSAPTFFSFLNFFSGDDFDQNVSNALGYKIFNQRFRKDFKLLKRNNIPQLEGHDFFQTKGAYSFDMLPNSKIVQTSLSSVATAHDIRLASPLFKTNYSFSLGHVSFVVHPNNNMSDPIHIVFDGKIDNVLRFSAIQAGVVKAAFDAETFTQIPTADFLDIAVEVAVTSEFAEFPFTAGQEIAVLSDFSTQIQQFDLKLFGISEVQIDGFFDSIKLDIRHVSQNSTFNVNSKNHPNRIAVNNQLFNRDGVQFKIVTTPLFSQVINNINKSAFSFSIESERKLIVNSSAPLETWTMIKVNPVSYSRPKMRLSNVAEAEIVNMWEGTPTQTWTLTAINSTTFNVIGSISGHCGVVYADGQNWHVIDSTSRRQLDIIIHPPTGSAPYTPIPGDYYKFHITNPLAFTPQFNLVFGYDLVEYDAPYYDTRFQYYNVNDLNFIMAPDIPNSIIEIKAKSNAIFEVRVYDKTQYYLGNKLHIGPILPDALVGIQYNSQWFNFTIVEPSHPSDPQSFAENDLFFIEVVNPPPVVDEPPYFCSVNMPFVHLYGESFVDVDAKKWIFTAISPTQFQVESSPTSAFSSPNLIVDTSYDNSECHLTFYPSLSIPIAVGDSFEFDIFENKPSYKVIGSISGESEMAEIGKWYNNGKIAFILDKPRAAVYSKFDTPNERAHIQFKNDPNLFVKLDDQRAVKIQRFPRSDASSDVYSFKFNSALNSFSVTSNTGTKIGLDFSQEYEWTDRLSNSLLSQNLSFDVKHADGDLSLTVVKTLNTIPVTFPDAYTFKAAIIAHAFPLYHSANGVIFDEIESSDMIQFRDFSEDKICISVDPTSPYMPSLLGQPAVSHLFSKDNTTDSSSQLLPHLGMGQLLTGGTKRNELGLICNRPQEYADTGTLNMNVFSAAKPSVKIAEVRQKFSNQKPIIQFNSAFINDFIGPQGTRFDVKIEQGQMMNTVAATRITESLKFSDIHRLEDVVNLSIVDSIFFNLSAKWFDFYDSVSVHINDENIPELYKFGGYDMLDYDDEMNDINLEVGGPLDPDNDGILSPNDPLYDSDPSLYDWNLRYAKQGMGVWATEDFTKPSQSQPRPQQSRVSAGVNESFVIYSMNLPSLIDDADFDITGLDSGVSATAIAQLGKMVNVSADVNSPLHNKTISLYGQPYTFTAAAVSPDIGKNVVVNGAVTDVMVSSAIVNHNITNISNIIVVDDLTSLNQISADVMILNANSFKITPIAPRSFVVIVV